MCFNFQKAFVTDLYANFVIYINFIRHALFMNTAIVIVFI